MREILSVKVAFESDLTDKKEPAIVRSVSDIPDTVSKARINLVS